MFRGKVTGFLAVVVCAVVFGSGAARAALITIEIEAVVDYVEDQGPGDGYLEGMIGVGDIITGFYTYDSDTPDSDPLAYAGMYEHHNPPAGISLNVGGFSFRTDPDNVDFVVAVLNGYPPSGKDQFWMISYNNLPLGNGVRVDGISWQLDDPSGSALSNIDLPTTPPVLGDWESVFGLRMYGDRMWGIDAHVTSAIPEPSTILFVGLGTVLLRKRQ